MLRTAASTDASGRTTRAMSFRAPLFGEVQGCLSSKGVISFFLNKGLGDVPSRDDES